MLMQPKIQAFKVLAVCAGCANEEGEEENDNFSSISQALLAYTAIKQITKRLINKVW